MRKLRSIIALLLCFLLVLPVAAWAEDPAEPVDPPVSRAQIIFDGKTITFDPSDTDLFINFKNVLPGDELTQPMQLVNNSSKKTSFYLKMKVAEQAEGLSEEQLKLVYNMLYDQDLMSVTITAGGETLYDEKAGGRRIVDLANVGAYTTFYDDTDDNGASIPLGTLNKNSQAEFEVTLTVSPAMGNEYMNLIAYVDWEFQIEAKSNDLPPQPEEPEIEPKPEPKPDPKPDPKPEEPVTPPEPIVEPEPEDPGEELPPPVFPNEEPVPDTGDNFPIMLCVGIVLISAIMIVVLTKAYRKLNKA